MTELEDRKKRLELIKQKYKEGVPESVIDDLADKCAKEIVKESYCNMESMVLSLKQHYGIK